MIKRALLCIGCLAMAAMGNPVSRHADQAEAAKAILDAWSLGNLAEAPRFLHVVLWTPVDREPVEGYGRRIDTALHGARDFFAGEMNRLGFGPSTMRFDYGKDGMIRVHLAKGRRPLAEYKTAHASEVREDSYRVLREFGLKPVNENVIVFCNLADGEGGLGSSQTPFSFPSSATNQGGLAWSVDGIPEGGLAWSVDGIPVQPKGGGSETPKETDEKEMIRGLCHRIGLSLGLSADSGVDSIHDTMGVSFMRAAAGGDAPFFMPWPDGLMLASHPLFSRQGKRAGTADKLEVSGWMVEPAASGFSIKGKVVGSPPVYGVVAHLRMLGKGSAAVATAVPAVDGSFELHCEGLSGIGDAEVRVVFLQVNGASSGYPDLLPHMFRYRINKDGEVDSTLMEAAMILVPFAEALWQNDANEIRRLLESPGIKDHAIFSEISARWMRRKEGREIVPDEAVASIALGDLKPEVAHTGYGPAVVDRLPGPQPLLISGGRLFVHGLYAHAPSAYTWNLQGKWGRLKGSAGLADGHPGTVTYLIEGDGRKIWSSPVVRAGEVMDFDVDVSGISKLVLKTTDAGDGKPHDWSLWLEPLLSR